MSHTTRYAQKVTDVETFCTICKELGHRVKYLGGKAFAVKHYGHNSVNNAIAEVHLKGWAYPLAISPDGSIRYDHFGSDRTVIGPYGEECSTMDLLGLTLQKYNSSVVLKNIDYTEIEGVFTEKDTNGDILITLEY